MERSIFLSDGSSFPSFQEASLSRGIENWTWIERCRVQSSDSFALFFSPLSPTCCHCSSGPPIGWLLFHLCVYPWWLGRVKFSSHWNKNATIYLGCLRIDCQEMIDKCWIAFSFNSSEWCGIWVIDAHTCLCTCPSQLLGSMERQGMYDGMSGCVLFAYIQNSEKRHCGTCGRVE